MILFSNRILVYHILYKKDKYSEKYERVWAYLSSHTSMYFPFDVSTSLGKKTIGEKKNVNKVEPVLSLLNGKASEKGVPKKKKKS